jgi:hypothetical protein
MSLAGERVPNGSVNYAMRQRPTQLSRADRDRTRDATYFGAMVPVTVTS